MCTSLLFITERCIYPWIEQLKIVCFSFIVLRWIVDYVESFTLRCFVMRFLVPLVWNLIPSLWFQICVILMLCKEYNSVILLKRAKAGVSFSKLKNVSKTWHWFKCGKYLKIQIKDKVIMFSHEAYVNEWWTTHSCNILTPGWTWKVKTI